MSTIYHAKYYAEELTRRHPCGSLEKLAASLSDARVDLNPHQVEAALFAFRSPFSKGALLADEVGLGKTIEAGILLAQRWAEHQRRLLVIVPASLRKQWAQELLEKFHLPSVILETHGLQMAGQAARAASARGASSSISAFDEAEGDNDCYSEHGGGKRSGDGSNDAGNSAYEPGNDECHSNTCGDENLPKAGKAAQAQPHNPLLLPAVVICSYQFAAAQKKLISNVRWDLVVIDEAHRLRNVYKPGSKMAHAIKTAVEKAPKLLLTATPLQNSLMELYGLISFIDEHTFGGLEGFKAQFTRLTERQYYDDLKSRLAPLCIRTLRRQVLEYVNYTNRIPLTQEFTPTEPEQRLYELVGDYLAQPTLYALPNAQRHLISLVMRKLLASSSFAIAGTLQGLTARLRRMAQEGARTLRDLASEIGEDFEALSEMAEEWETVEQESGENAGIVESEANEDAAAEHATLLNSATPSCTAANSAASPSAKPLEPPQPSRPPRSPGTKKVPLSAAQIAEIEQEIERLRECGELAQSIQHNAKGDVLLSALQRGFAKARELGAPQKAVIFTESTRTQRYLLQLLEATEFAGRIVLFNGSNSDAGSQRIYAAWLQKHADSERVTGVASADKRAALVDYFRDEATILVATEAAAEGINLQFCSLVVNYDLPWNPQRIEQRIGRCHRYGQRFDVVVINFLNKANEADQRVYQILFDKFKLFDGVFGASDEILGTIESGVDFEKRIAQIYDLCRTSAQIDAEFAALQKELEEEIRQTLSDVRRKLLENFDEEVSEKLRVNAQESRAVLGKFDTWLWRLTQFYLAPYAHFSGDLPNGDPAARQEPLPPAFILHTNPFPLEAIPRGPYGINSNKGQRRIEEENIYRIGHPLAQRIIGACKRLEAPPAIVAFNYSDHPARITILDDLRGRHGWLVCEKLTLAALATEEHILLAGCDSVGAPLLPEQCQRMFSLPGEVRKNEPLYPEEEDEEEARFRAQVIRESIDTQRETILAASQTRSARIFEAEMEKLDHWGEDQRRTLRAKLTRIEEELKRHTRDTRLASNLQKRLQMEREKRALETVCDEAWRAYETASRDIERQKDELLNTAEAQMCQSITQRNLFTLHWRVE